MNISLSPFALENMVSRNGFGSPVPRQPAHLHTQAEYGITHIHLISREGVGKERRIKDGSTHYWNYRADYWHCTENAIGTQ